MDLNIFKKSDPSGKMSKEKYVFNNHRQEWQYIIDYCKLNGILDVTFKEMVYLCINNIQSIPICNNENCNNRVKFKNSTIGYLGFCSTKCVSSDDKIKKLKENSSIKKFGTKSPAQSRIIKDKIINTNLNKWGANSPMSNILIKNKSKQTLIKNWGVDNPNKSEEIKVKRIESFKKSEYRKTFRGTSLSKWGVEHPWMDKEIHGKSIETSKEIKNIRTKSLIEDKLKNYPGYEVLDIDYDNPKKIVKAICKFGHIFEITRHSIYERNLYKSEICTICNPIFRGISGMETSLLNFISDNYKLKIIENSRKLIPPFEIDIYLPDINLAIEFNGLFWHSDINKSYDYHYKKYKLCSDRNIKLITIWEDEWIYKNEIVKSFILNKLNKTANKIGSRKCKIKEVSYADSKLFLDSNHLQGNCISSIRIGLYYDDMLVSLMTFSKLRLPFNKGGKNIDGWELTRFCNKINTNVVGGASRLLNHFIKKYKPNHLESYSDNLISDGDLYKKLGFQFSNESKPGYWYVIDNIRSHRFNWRKDKLVKMGYDPLKTEYEIMSELGYYRIWGAGNKKWILIK